MATINIFGRLTGDPENKPGNDGRAIAHFSIADNHGKDSNGADKVSFFRCSAFGKQAELILASCKKGHRLNVSGRFESRQFTGNNGPQTSLDVSVQNFDFVEQRDNAQQAPTAQPPAPGPYPPQAQPPRPAAPPVQQAAQPVQPAQPMQQYDSTGNLWQVQNGQWVMIRQAAATAQPPMGCPPGERPF